MNYANFLPVSFLGFQRAFNNVLGFDNILECAIKHQHFDMNSV